jgi:hypothetical protein
VNLVAYTSGSQNSQPRQVVARYFAYASTFFRSVRSRAGGDRLPTYLCTDVALPARFCASLADLDVEVVNLPFETFRPETAAHNRGPFYLLDVMRFVAGSLPGVSIIADSDMLNVCNIPVAAMEEAAMEEGILTVNPYHRSPPTAVHHKMDAGTLCRNWREMGLPLPARPARFDYWSGGEFLLGCQDGFARFADRCRDNLMRFDERAVHQVKGPFDGNEYVITYSLLQMGYRPGGSHAWCDRLHRRAVREIDGVEPYPIEQVAGIPFWHLPSSKFQLANLFFDRHAHFEPELLYRMLLQSYATPGRCRKRWQDWRIRNLWR